MTYFSVTLTFDKPIPKTSIKKLKKEIYDKIFRVEWLIKSIYFSKSDISCKGDKSFIKFRSDYENSEKTLTPLITTALKGSAWSRLYLDDSLKAIKLDVDVKTKKTKKKKKGGSKNKVRSSRRRKAKTFLRDLGKQRLQSIEEKTNDMKKVDQWKGVGIEWGDKKIKVHIEIFKPKQKNYIISIKPRLGVYKYVFGPLTNVIKHSPLERLGHVNYERGLHRVCLNYTARGSHQGGPVHPYKDQWCMFSKDEKTIDNLSTFLSKYSNKVTDKRKKKTKEKKKTKKGGSKKMSSKEFKVFLLGKEKEYENDRKKCSRTCSKIKTNYAQNKGKLIKKTKCYATCEKKRLTSIQKIHKQYPKEFKLYLNNL